MEKIHPYALAEYTVFRDKDQTYGVTIATPETSPARITPFASRKEAEAWIADHKARVAQQAPDMRSPNRFRRPAGARTGSESTT